MNKLGSIVYLSGVLIMVMLLLPGCSTAEAIPETVANGSAGNPVAPAIEVPEPDLQPAVPRVKQAQVIGVVRELVNSGCLVKKVASTDGVHYSQLVITCGDAQQAPPVE